MRFAHPHLLWLLLVLPAALVLFYWWSERRRRRLLTQFVEARLLAALTAGISSARRKFRFALFTVAVALLVIAAARPQYGYDQEEVRQKGLDIVVAVDTSKSMLATDIAPDRLERAKLAALELMQTAKADRLGLVAFAGEAFLQCPLTTDNTAFQQSVQSLSVNSLPIGGTDLADAIGTAQTAFADKDSYKVMVLLTDGEDNNSEADALAAARDAAKAGMKIFTIGTGTTEGTLVTVPDGQGGTEYIHDDKGQVLKSKLNETLLRQIAEITGGFYLPLRGADTIPTLYSRGLAPLPKTEGNARVIRRYHEQYHWPLALALLLLAGEMLVPERKQWPRNGASDDSSRTRGNGQPPRLAGAAVALVLLAALGTSAHAATTPADALRAYQAGDYTNALSDYTRLAEVHTNDLRLVFNAGAAAYRATNFDLAQKLFQQATLAPDLKLQQAAYYNLGNTQFQLAKQAKDLDGLEHGFDAAAKLYERAVNLNTNDADAGFNLKFAQAAVAQIREIKAALRSAKGSADTAVQRAEFHRALDIMEALEQRYKIAAKQFEEFTKKLKNIDVIENPRENPGQP